MGVIRRTRFYTMLAVSAVAAARCFTPALNAQETDPYLWLEDIDAPRSLQWVAAQNARTAKSLAGELRDSLYRDALSVLDLKSRIPEVTQKNGFVYTTWKDAHHPRGIFRRIPTAQFLSGSEAWEPLLDIDALAAAEGKPWVLNRVVWNHDDPARVLLELAPSGGDATAIREFDLGRHAFVEGGFATGVAKHRLYWNGPDSLYIATDFGPGSLTQAGYPRQVRLWKRSSTLSLAEPILEVAPTSNECHAEVFHSSGPDIALAQESIGFFHSRFFLLQGGAPRALPLPESAIVVGAFEGRLVVRLREDWHLGSRTLREGSVVLADPKDLSQSGVELVAAPSAHEVVSAVSIGKSALLLSTLDNVKARLSWLRRSPGGWERVPVGIPDFGSVRQLSVDADSGSAFFTFESFTQPPSLLHLDEPSGAALTVRQQQPSFDPSRFEARQFWATSADGTQIPYFLVAAKDAPTTGKTPTWMFAYGGFETSVLPSYSGSYEDTNGAYGKLWLERGGCFVLANLRGGGEFGPAWHRAAVRENHVKAFEDFEAVAKDLFKRGITSPKHLGIEGRSNGGLLVTSLMVRHPEYYGAIVCGSPLVDMRRYSRLLAGASWRSEYGDPDVPADWSFISTYSPYQLVKPAMGLPPIFFYTSTRDDRVHPGHARKMAAKMEDMGYPVEYLELTEGGHHASVTHEQLAGRLALTYAFLWEHLR